MDVTISVPLSVLVPFHLRWYHAENTGSRLIIEVKQCSVRSILTSVWGWGRMRSRVTVSDLRKIEICFMMQKEWRRKKQISLTLHLFSPLSLCFPLTLYLCLSLWMCFFPSVCLSPSVCVCVCVYVNLCVCLFRFYFLSSSLSLN